MNRLYGLFVMLFLTEYAELPGNGGFYSEALNQGEYITDISKVGYIAAILLPTQEKNIPFELCTVWFSEEDILITAGHCLVDRKHVDLVVGKFEIGEDIEPFEKIRIFPHQFEIHEKYYHDGTMKNDYAKIKLDKPLENYPVNLPVIVNRTLNDFMSETLTLYGYGSLILPYHLKHCNVKYISGATAKKNHYHDDPEFNEEHTICTWPANGGTNYEHSYGGDSGGFVLDKDYNIVAILLGGDPGEPDVLEPIAQHYDFIHRPFKSQPIPNPHPKQPTNSPAHQKSVDAGKHLRETSELDSEHLTKKKNKIQKQEKANKNRFLV